MAVIFQPDRFLLYEQIKQVSKYIKGITLDVGAGGYDRYSGLFNCEKYIRLDRHFQSNVQIIADAEFLPFKADSFDSIVCTQVLEHLRKPYKTLREMQRVLKEEGHILLTVPQTNELHEEPNDFYRYTKYGMEALLQATGFEIVHLSQRGGFFATIAQQIIRYFIDRLDLYRRGFLARILNRVMAIFGYLMVKLDNIDKSSANRKHTIGWCIIEKKVAR